MKAEACSHYIKGGYHFTILYETPCADPMQGVVGAGVKFQGLPD